jgi:hypothetical protein
MIGAWPGEAVERGTGTCGTCPQGSPPFSSGRRNRGIRTSLMTRAIDRPSRGQTRPCLARDSGMALSGGDGGDRKKSVVSGSPRDENVVCPWFPGGKRAFATTPTSTPPATESRCLPVCHPATDARIDPVGQGDADCGPVTVSLSPAIDCHAQRARQDALMPGQAWRETAG